VSECGSVPMPTRRRPSQVIPGFFSEAGDKATEGGGEANEPQTPSGSRPSRSSGTTSRRSAAKLIRARKRGHGSRAGTSPW